MRDVVPVDACEESFDVGFFVTVVLVVIRVLPEVDAEDGLVLRRQDSIHHRVVFIVRCYDSQNLLFLVNAEP